MGKSTTSIILILGVVTVAFAGYYLYMQQSNSLRDLTTTEVPTAELLNRTQVFIDYGKSLSMVKLNVAFFEDPHGRSLKSFSTPIESRPVGRTNPFLEPNNAN